MSRYKKDKKEGCSCVQERCWREGQEVTGGVGGCGGGWWWVGWDVEGQEMDEGMY